MNGLRALVLVIINISYVLCKTCYIGDVKDNTAGANRNYRSFINGVEPVIPSSDPMYADLITAELPGITYIFKKASFSGMRNCTVLTLRICKGDKSFYYSVLCPRISLTADYEAKGQVGQQYVDGKGIANVDRDDCNFLFYGNYETYTGDDGLIHLRVTNFDFGTSAGNVKLNLSGLFDGDEEKAAAVNKYLNENWKTLDSLLAGPTLKIFMDKYFEHLNLYLKSVSLEAAFGL